MTSTVLVEPKEAPLLVGASIRRTEDYPLITGQSRFVDDFSPPRCLHLGIVRSTYAHAKLRGIETSRLAELPGVVAVLTGAEMKEKCKPIFNWVPNKALKTNDTYPLAVDVVRFVGEPVVAIVCETKSAASDAIELVDVDYEELPVVTDADAALKAGAPLLYPEWGTNRMLYHTFKSGDVESALNEADLVVRETISCHRHSAAPLEPNTYMASYGPGSGLTVWATTQHAHLLRTIIAETLGIRESKVRVIQPDVGGGFGAKSPVHAEEILVSFLAVQLGATVKFVEERIEHLKASHQAREQTHHIEVAVRRDGTITAIRDRIVANLGIYYPTAGPNSVINASRFITGCYKIENYETEVIGAATNKAPYGAYRGFGKDAASYVIERTMDIIAAKLGIDPIELRMRNIVDKSEFPYRSVTGAIFDSGDYAACLEQLKTLVNYDQVRAQQRERRKDSKYLGIGISLVLEPASSHGPNTLFTGYDGSTARLEPSGEITIHTGVTGNGTGIKTTFAQIAADALGAPFDIVSVTYGDSSSDPYGYGMWASRGVVVGGSSVLLASTKLKEKILGAASALLRAKKEELFMQSGVVRQKGKQAASVTLKDVASAFYRSAQPLPREVIEGGLEATAYYFPPTVESVPDKEGRRNVYATYGSSACAAVVEVDVETGATKVLKYAFVGDSGKIINPLVLDGQIHGGIVQGLGGAMYEENLYDENGQPLAATFMDYILPSATEAPEMVIGHLETPTSATMLGAKGAGEGPIEGVYGTLANAVEDALAPMGVRIRDLPLTSERLWKLISAAQKKG